jgi:uncharacterized membrane protein
MFAYLAHMAKVLTYLFGALLVAAGFNHFINPTLYNPFIPDFMPKLAVNYASGLAEIIAGAGVFFPRFRKAATLGILALMILFLPLHTIDVFRAHPAIGSHTAAVIRLPVQLVLIAWAWYCWASASRQHTSASKR